MLLKNDHIFVVFDSPGGMYNTQQLQTILNWAQKESPFIKVTETQRIACIVKDISATKDQFKATGLTVKPYRSDNNLTPTGIKPCLGGVCPHHQQDAFAHGVALGEDPSLGDTFSISINGCSQACVPSITDDIHCVGNASGYQIFLGGRSQEGSFSPGLPLDQIIPGSQMPDFFKHVLNIKTQQIQPGELFSQCVQRLGALAFAWEPKESLSLSAPPKEETMMDDTPEMKTPDKEVPVEAPVEPSTESPSSDPSIEANPSSDPEFNEATDEDMSKILGSLQENYSESASEPSAIGEVPGTLSAESDILKDLGNPEESFVGSYEEPTQSFSPPDAPQGSIQIQVLNGELHIQNGSLDMHFPLKGLPSPFHIECQGQTLVLSQDSNGHVQVSMGPLVIVWPAASL